MMIPFIAGACLLFCCAGTTKDKAEKKLLLFCTLACLILGVCCLVG